MGSKTVITGDNNTPQSGSVNELYAPSTPNTGKRTYIADIHRSDGMSASPQLMPEEGSTINLQPRILAGVLFSVSRSSRGEIFPLYLGRNIIGSETECDIRLMEQTVSPAHAVIVVRRTVHDNGSVSFEASITDCNSACGTRLGDTRLDFERRICSDGDIITVGLHYRLLMYLFDTVHYGLKVDPDFSPLTELPVENLQEREDSTRTDQDPKVVRPAHETMSTEQRLSFYSPTKKEQNSHTQNETIIT